MDSKTDFELNLNLEIISFDFTLPARDVPGCMFSQVHTKTIRDFESRKLSKTVLKIKNFCGFKTTEIPLFHPKCVGS